MSQYMCEKLTSAADSGELDIRDSEMARNAADAIGNLMKERDELAAYAKSLEKAIHDAVMHPVSVNRDSAEAEEVQDLRDIIGNAVSESPAISLARREGEFAARVLDELSRQVKTMDSRATAYGIGVHIALEAKAFRENSRSKQ